MSATFRGGVHPHDDHKAMAKDRAIQDAPIPAELVVPLSQHIGAPAQAAVKPGETVKRGQLIAEAGGFVSAAVHSPVSGTVKKLTQTLHPLGPECDAILIENDGEDTWAEGRDTGEKPVENCDAETIRKAVQEAGIVGMGGATFPTHVKLSPPAQKPIDTVILNGVECEPYLTADYRLMLESPETIVKGLQLLLKAVGAKRGIVGIEANKPDAYEAIKSALIRSGGPFEAVLLEVKYPQGAEKQLIDACLRREVPSGGLPMDVGALVQNVGTAHAVYEAVCLNRPLTERITTVTGGAVERPGNFRVRVGTPAKVLLDLCGYQEFRAKKLIFGGPMMGAAHFDTSVPVNKGMSGILGLTEAPRYVYRDCIRCSRCVDHCPAGLMPSAISIRAERGEYFSCTEVDILDCIECGVCTYICPARRPIVQWVKTAKSAIAAEKRKAQKKSTEKTKS